MMKMIPLFSGTQYAEDEQDTATFSPSKWGRGFADRLTDLLLPPSCLSCHQRIDCPGLLCPPCWSSVIFIEAPYCDKLGIPLPYDAGDEGGPVLSAGALAAPPLYDRARAVAHYEGVMRDLIHGLKYGDHHESVDIFCKWMIHAGRDLLAGADVILPVPLYRLRLWSRRFNQSALLADAIGKEMGLPVYSLWLKRARQTRSQVGLSLLQRQKNVAGAFKIAPARRAMIEGRHIVLIDDVITTGATAEACAKCLKAAGAGKVDVLALARVVDPLKPPL